MASAFPSCACPAVVTPATAVECMWAAMAEPAPAPHKPKRQPALTLANASCTYPAPASDSTGTTLIPAASHRGMSAAKARCSCDRTP